METGADFQQRADAAVEIDLAGGGFGDAAEDFEQRALARAVAADDADDVALSDVEGHVAQRPERFLRGAPERMARALEERFRQRGRPVAFVGDRVRLGQPADGDGDVAR